MAARRLIAAVALGLAACGALAAPVAWRGGLWFDGERFVPGTRWKRKKSWVGSA